MNSKETVTRAYNYRLPKEVQEDALRTLDFVLSKENDLISKLWNEDFLKAINLTLPKHIGRWMENYLDRPKDIPSRVWRGILEQVGRVLRSQADKKELFYFLKNITTDEQQWCWQLCKDNGKPFVKANYIYSLKNAVEKYKEKHNGEFPNSYFDITQCPKFKNGILTYAPDDGQAIKYKLENDTLKVKLKLLSKEGCFLWRETSFNLPHIVLKRLKEENGSLKSPDLRWYGGKAFLDLKVETHVNEHSKDNSNKMFVDWGTTRKLLTIIITTAEGTQIGQPLFLKYEPIFKKLHRIRQHIDHLKKGRAKVARRKNRKRWDRYTDLIKQSWLKYKELQKELAHLASNAIVDLAEAYGCDEIYVEDLSTLKAQNFGKWLNRVINNTVRGQIYDKVFYKAKLKGIKLNYVKAWHTSVTCPVTGKRGKRYTAPDGKERKGGGWFTSDSFNADADYVACKNLARRVLFNFKLSYPKALAYKERAILDKQFGRGIRELQNLQRALSGWHGTLRVVPLSVFSPIRA